MVKDYFRIVIRNLKTSRLYSGINICGLSVGICCCLLLGLYVRHEISFDDFHEKADRICLFTQWENDSGSGSGFAQIIRSEVSQAEEVLRIIPVRALVGIQENAYYEDNFCFADSVLFKVFSIRIVQGNGQAVFHTQYGVLISASMSNKYFPREDPVGKTIHYGNAKELIVMGVFEDLPSRTHLRIDFISNIQHAEELLEENLRSFWDGRSLTYVLFPRAGDIPDAGRWLPAIVAKTADPNRGIWKPGFISLRDIYLRSKMAGKVKSVAAIQDVYIFSGTALLILLLAAFNFINLATARSGLRGREVGVRKVLGAHRRGLVLQFLFESAFHTLVAVVLSVALAIVLLPAFNDLAGTNLDLTSFSASFILLSAAGVVAIILLTGAYPAIVLSSFSPASVLKSHLPRTAGGSAFRRSLVICQFTVSVVMIVSTLVVMEQINFIWNKDLGYETDRILTIDFPEAINSAQRKALKDMLNGLSSIASVSLCNSLPGKGSGQEKLVEEYVPRGAERRGIDHIQADADFIETFGLRVVEGSDFKDRLSGNRPSGTRMFLVNESAVKYFGWDDPVGQTIGYYTYRYSSANGYEEVPVTGQVVGVVNDYHQADLKTRIQPLMISNRTDWLPAAAIKIAAGKTQEGLLATEKVWKELFPGIPFAYQFLDTAFDLTYKKEARTSRIFRIFAVLAIVISGLGLFGLSSFTAQQRNREIGIRRVFGASVMQLSLLLSRDYLRLVIVANALAFPLAWWGMSRWLMDFSYRIEPGIRVFLIGGLLSLIVALCAISGQTIRASNMNPIRTLRDE